MIKKICSIIMLLILLLNSSVLVTISTAVDEIQEMAKSGAKTDEKISMDLNYTQLTNKVQNELVITGILEKDTEDCKLYENPVVSFEFPEEVEKILIKDIKVLYDDELILGKYQVETSNDGRQVIRVPLIGKQTKYQTDGITKGTNIRVVANIMLKQDIESNVQKITMTCGTAKFEKEVQLVNSQELKTLDKIDELEGTKVYASGLLIETKAIRGDTLLNNNDVIYENEIIKYEVKVTNTTNSKINNIKIVGSIPDHMGYVALACGELGYGFSIDDTIKQKEIDVGTLNVDETKEYSYELQVRDDIDTRTLNDQVTADYVPRLVDLQRQTENYDTMTDEEKWQLRYNLLRNIILEKKPQATEDEIQEVSEYAIKKIHYKSDYEILNKNANPDYIEKVEAQIDVFINNKTISTYKITHNIKITEINAIMTNSESSGTRNLWNYNVTLYRPDVDNGLEEIEKLDVELTFKLPSIFQLENVNSVTEHDKKLEYSVSKDGIVTIKINGIDETYQLGFKTKAINIEENENYTYKAIMAVNVTTNSGKTYKSNQTIANGAREAVKITQTSESNLEQLESLDKITYVFNIQNVGKAQESFGGYTTINFEDFIPNTLKIESVEYNDNDVRVKSVDGERKIIVTPANKTWNANQLSEANKKDSKKEPRIKLKLNIKNDETITIKIVASVKLIDAEEYDETIENYATVSGEQIKTKESNIITNTIHKESGKVDVVVTPTNPDIPTKPTDPTSPSNPTNPSTPDNPNGGKYTISGLAWIDEDENGKIDSNENLKEGLKVSLFDVNNKRFLTNEQGNIITNYTNSQGKYSFKDVPEGKYYVVVEYDTNEYSITEYQKPGVSELTNCDFISKMAKLSDGQRIIGITNTINLTQDMRNIDIGLIKNKIFDLKMEQFVQKITITNSKGTKEYSYDNKKLAKFEIHSKQFAGSTVVIEYKIVVTNVGEIAGSVNEIIAEIPQAFDFHSELNNEWSKSMTYNLSNKEYRTTEIQPGQSIEATLVLSKKLDNNSAGSYKNITKIGISENKKHVQDSNTENDIDSTEVIIGVSTGIKKIFGIIFGVIGLSIIAMLIFKKLRKYNKINIKAFFVIILLIAMSTFNIKSYAANPKPAYNGQTREASHYVSVDGVSGSINGTSQEYSPEFVQQMHELDNQGFISGAIQPCPGGHGMESSGSDERTWNEYQDFINPDGSPKGDISVSATLKITGQSTFDAIVSVSDGTGAPGDISISVSCTGGGGSGSVSAGGGTTTISCSGAEFILGATITANKVCETTYTEVTEITTWYEWVPAVHYTNDHEPSPYSCTASNPVNPCHQHDYWDYEWVDDYEEKEVEDENGNKKTEKVKVGEHKEWFVNHSKDDTRYVFATINLGSAGSSTSTVYAEIPITYSWSDSTSFGPGSFPKKVQLNKLDYDTGEILPGCIFEIDGRTVASGEKIDMIMVGAHTIKEIKVPYGYNYEIGKTYTVTINPNDTLVTVTATNKKETGNLYFKKVDMVTGRPLEGVVIEVMDLLPDDKHGSGGKVRYTTDKNGEVRVYDLLLDKDTEERTFYIKEVYNPHNGYVVDDADYGDVIDSEGNKVKAMNHPEYGVVYPTKIKRQVATETGKVLLEATDKTTNAKINGLQFVVTGLLRENSSSTINGGATGTTEVVNSGITYTTNANGQIIIPDLLNEADIMVYATCSNADIEVKDIDGNIVQPSEKGYELVVKGKNPNEEQIGSNMFQSNTFTIENEIKYAKLSGNVWNDGEYDKRNNSRDENDKDLSGVKVKLYDPVNNVVHETWTNEKGEYIFGDRKDKAYDFGTTPGSDDENYKDTHVLLRRASEYYVEFEYNGVKYRNVALNTDPKDVNGSKASEEIASGKPDEDSTERRTFNHKFTTIDENQKIDTKGETTGIVENGNGDKYPDVISYNKTGDHQSGINYGKNMQDPEADPEAYGEEIYHITATTYKNYDFKTYYDPDRDTTGYTDEIKAVNIGLYEREQVDLELESDLARIDLNVNGYNNVYKFGTLITPNSGKELEEKFKEIQSTCYQRTIHSSSVVYSANNGTTGENGNVYADITYKMYLENKAENLKSTINEITINYNSKLECISYNYEGENATQINDGTQINDKLKELVLDVKALGNRVINNKNQNVLEVTFRAKAEVLAEILKNEKTLQLENKEYKGIKFDFMAEIKSYTTYSNNEEKLVGRDDNLLYVYASIDKDSAPRNAQIELDDQERFVTDTFEDDTTIAPTIVLTTGSQTKLSGVVFEDAPEEDKLENNERLGDGMYDDRNESVMQNVKVEVLLVPVEANQPYDSTLARNGLTLKQSYEVAKLYQTDATGTNVNIVDAITYTDENGMYQFDGLVADNYVIRYTYGENISGENGRSTCIYKDGRQVKNDAIKAREYKSTIITSDHIRRAVNTSSDGMPHLNGDWEEGNTEVSWFKNNPDQRYSDAVDDVEYRAFIEANAKINNETIKDSSKYAYSEMEAYTPYFKLGVEDFNDQNVSDTLEIQEAGTIDYTFHISNVDFGLIERPIVDLKVNKQITDLKLTLGSGQVLINGNPSDQNVKLPYVKTGLEDFVPIEMDTELIHNSTIKEEYTLSIENKSELDYPIYQITNDTDVPNCRNYYYYGKPEGVSADYKPVTVRVDVLADYLCNEIATDPDEMRNNGWDMVQVNNLTSYNADDGKTYNLIEEDVENVLNKGKYTLYISDIFADQNGLLVRIGDTQEFAYNVSRLLASKDEMKYTNNIEILQYIGYSQNKNKDEEDRFNRKYDTTPGDLIPELAKEDDEDNVKTTITPPTGVIISKTLYVITAIIGLIVIAGCVILIKKKIVI